MQLNKRLRTVVFLLLIIGPLSLNAQQTDALGTYSPYSLFGIGDIEKQGTSFNYSMGGLGIGIRDRRFINYANPASITERDTLSFMMDFGVTQKNNYIADSKTTSAYNVFNMHNILITVPLYKKSAFIIGVAPYSNTGYKFESTETDPALVSKMGDIKYQKYGTGSINQLFAGAAMVIANNLSVGAQAIYYFGTLDRHSNALFNSSSSYNSLLTGWEYKISSFSGKFGLQYSQPLKNYKNLTIGATYRLGNRLNGDIMRYAYSASSSETDTVSYEKANNINIKIASEMGLGISYRKRDKWMVGFDYVRQNWKNSVFAETPGVKFSPCVSHSFRAGFEVIPNRFDARYYMKRVTYRGGAYYDKSYISLNGHQIYSFGITVGASLPIYKWYNAISVAVEAGQRGMTKDNLVRERYVNFMVNINLHDIWFIKYRYD